MRRFSPVAVVCGLILASLPVQAWFDGGHMLVAYIAYRNLTTRTRSRVDTLLKVNPLYSKWIAGVPSSQRGLTAFLRAATWPDCIKQPACAAGYTSDGGDTPPGNPSDNQNIGYSDKLMHRYWHFIDIPYEEGATGQPPKVPNALTEIQILTTGIGSTEADAIKSYDIAWLEHLVGDVHQPLHSTSRFTKNHPNGDAGGNFLEFCQRPCRDELHAYWDGLAGDKPTIAQVTTDGDAIVALGAPAGSADALPANWVQASFQLARTNVYIPPISGDNDPSVPISPRPDAAYAAQAGQVARSQIALAGYRLANLLNNNLK